MKKLKTKINLALVFLLVIIISLGVFGSNFIGQLADDSRAIIEANYKSIGYVASMQKAAERIFDIYVETTYNAEGYRQGIYKDEYTAAVAQFENGLKKEINNITESGEEELTDELRASFNKYKQLTSAVTDGKIKPVSPASLDSNKTELNELLWKIQNLNMQAIVHKSGRAERTAGRVSKYMIISGSLAALFALLLLIYFPGYLLRPLSELREKIKEISQGRYNQKVEISAEDEIGELAQTFNIMADRLYQYDRNNIHKLLVEKKRLESIMNGLNDAVLIIDENKRILYANKILLEITGINEKTIAGSYAPDIATDSDIVRYLIQDLTAFTGQAEKEESVDQLKNTFRLNGRYYSKEIIEIKLDEDSLQGQSRAGFICILKNITEYEERNSAKTNLIATVSHELKTPLSSINLSLKLLENSKLGLLNNDQKKILISIRQQTLRLSKMVNELLDFSQAESGNIKLRMAKASPNDILDYAATAMMVLLADKSINLETSAEDNLPMVYADLEKSVWVLTNLITNAVRYTAENGTIALRVTGGEGFVVFSVQDYGAGIPDEDREKIFKKFVQADGANTKGRGLGLAISKEFVTSQGGSIWVESEPGKGSTFFFSLPVYKSVNGKSA